MVALLAVFGWQAGAVLALGLTCFVSRAGPVPPVLVRWREQLRILMVASIALAVLAGVGVLLAQSVRLTGALQPWSSSTWPALLLHTRFGEVWIAKQIILVALLWVALFASRTRGLIIALASVFLVVGVWAGHGGTADPGWIFLPLQAWHAIAAGAWLGGLPAWMLLVFATHDQTSHQFLAQAVLKFSQFATVAVISLVLSGVIIASTQLTYWRALFGMRYGGVLSLKLALIACALAAAFRLRTAVLPRLQSLDARDALQRARPLILLELLCAFAAFMVALQLARTTPGAHAAIHWWLPWRLAPAAAWALPTTPWLCAISACLLVGALGNYLRAARRVAAVLALGALGSLAYALSVPAYPSTYQRPSVAYTAQSVAAGIDLYQQHCPACHGAGGRGDGVAASRTAKRPPDLSEHTALHTAGDMYWWLSHGVPTSGMPAFDQVLTRAQRWSLINFLRAFADGYRARVLTSTVVPNQPWLVAPDFQYETSAGDSGQLSDFREQRAVLLVIADAEQAVRIQRLTNEIERLRAAGAELLLVGARGTPHTARISVGADAIQPTYSLFARTLSTPGSRHAVLPAQGHAEFLIDRFGYLRARWLPASEVSGWDDLAVLQQQIQQLAAEPKLRELPDDHVH